MNSNTGGASAVTFEYGVVTANGNVPIMQGTPDAGSVSASGVIQIAIANDKVGNPGAGSTLSLVSGRNFAGNGNATVTKTSAFDSTADGAYTLVGNAACAVAPVPVSAASAKTHGAAGSFNIALPLTGNPGIECRTGGASGNHQMIVTFPAPVTISSAMVSAGTGSVSSTTVNGNVVIVNLTGVANAQTITVTLAGVSMGSNFGNVVVPMALLLGDTTGNGAVNSSDISQTQSQSGQEIDPSNFREDVTANGAINSSDIATVQAQSGTALP
jgi:hypothetical protein